MSSDGHIIYVISNANADDYSNSLTQFTNRLPKHLELKKSEWEVALTAYGVHLNFCSVTVPENEVILSIFVKWQFDSLSLYNHSDIFYNFPGGIKLFSTGNHFGSISIYKKVLRFIRKSEYLRDKVKVSRDEITGKISFENISSGSLYFIIEEQLIQVLCLEKFIAVNAQNSYSYKGLKYIAFHLRAQDVLEGEEMPLFSTKLHPSLINISCNLGNPYQSDDHHSQILYTASVPVLDTISYHYFIPEKPIFYNIAFDHISEVNIQFLDQNLKKLPLLEGSASFVKLTLRKKRTMSKLINLRATSQITVLNPHNTSTKFISQLVSPIEVTSNASIGLSAISFPNDIKNVTKQISVCKFKIAIDLESNHPNDVLASSYESQWGCMSNEDDKCEIITFQLKEGFYKSNDDFLNMVNAQIYAATTKEILKLKHAEFFCIIQFKIACRLYIPKEFSRIFGYNSAQKSSKNDDYFVIKVYRANDYIFDEPMMVNDYYPNYLLCYSNIVEPTIIGSIYANILKVIPTKLNNTRYTTTEFDNIDYMKLNCRILDNLHFEFRSHDGELIDFVNNDKIVLHLVVKI